jgi:hypothetical protein
MVLIVSLAFTNMNQEDLATIFRMMGKFFVGGFSGRISRLLDVDLGVLLAII